MIRFNCRQCGAKLQVGEKHAGKKTRCLNCGKPIEIPQPATLSKIDIDAILEMVDDDPLTKIHRVSP